MCAARLQLCDRQSDLMAASCTPERGRGPWRSPVCAQRQQADVSPRRRASVDSSTSVCLSVCLSGLVEQSDGGDGNRAARRVERTRHTANLPGHLARLALFKQVPRRFVSRLVKCLTF